MERIQFYPKGENPKGKNYIFFVANAVDQINGLEILWKDICQIEPNSAIWYDSAPDKPCDSDFWKNLKLLPIRIIVVWVTHRLLNHNAALIRQLFAYARQQNVSILPIIQETGIDGAYQKLFGTIQYLSALDSDPTAIPYKQKLENHLLDVLTDTQTFQRVRNAFTGYIFMSYRKKDRAFANDLMKKIHVYPPFRDIAIWYDEFLVPGEAFDESIRTAMSKSDLFALLVTSNLLEPKNYVMTTEFPEAKKAGMRILPIQMAEINQGRLRKEFDGIPPKVNGFDRKALEEALKHNIPANTTAIIADAEHDYLIGLAYWNGIDVETNRQLGEELITRAAKAGETAAMYTLANIYKSRADYILTGEDSIVYLERYLQIMEYLHQRFPTENLALNIAQAYLRLNDLICIGRGAPSKALDCCNRAKSILLELTLSPQTVSTFEMLVNTYGTIACTLSSIGKHTQAKEEFEESIALCDDLYAQSKDPVFLYKKSLLYMRQAETLRKAQQTGEAMRNCKLSKNIAEDLIQHSPILGYRAMRNLWDEFAEIYTVIGIPNKIIQSRENRLSCAEKAAKMSNDWFDCLQYITALDESGDRYMRQGDNRTALLYYNRIAQACRNLKEDQIPEPLQRSLVKIKTDLGQNLYHTGKPEEAAKVLSDIYPTAEMLMNSSQDPEDQYQCSAVLFLWGCSVNNLDLIDQAKVLLAPILRMHPNEEEYRNLMTKIKQVLK